METTPQVPGKRSSAKFWIVVILAGALLVVIAGAAVWDATSGVEEAQERDTRERSLAYQQFIVNYETAMRNDTWGGKTPEETLQLFITALEAGDTDLAAKYFMLETDESSPNYLTRRKWEDGLRKAKEEGRLGEIITKLRETRLQPLDLEFPDLAIFESSENSNDDVAVFVNMQLNRYSYSWKLISFSL